MEYLWALCQVLYLQHEHSPRVWCKTCSPIKSYGSLDEDQRERQRRRGPLNRNMKIHKTQWMGVRVCPMGGVSWGSSSSPGVPESKDLASVSSMMPMYGVTLGSLCNLSKPKFYHLQNADHFISSPSPSSHVPLFLGCLETECSPLCFIQKLSICLLGLLFASLARPIVDSASFKAVCWPHCFFL